MSSDTRAPLTIRLSMSRPVIGSTPNGCARLIPPNGPFGRLKVGLIRFAWYTVGFCTRNGPKIATRIRKTHHAAADHGHLVTAQPHPGDLAERPALDGLTADPFEHALGYEVARRGHVKRCCHLAALPCCS